MAPNARAAGRRPRRSGSATSAARSRADRRGEQQLGVEPRASRPRRRRAPRWPRRAPRGRSRPRRVTALAPRCLNGGTELEPRPSRTPPHHPASAVCASSRARFSSAAERRGELAQVAAEDLVEVVRGELDPVVGDPALGEVVGADLLRPLAGADLRAAVGRDLGPLLLERALVQSRPQHPHRLVAVLQLRLLVLHRDHDPGRLVGDPHRGVGRVHRSARRAPRSGRRRPGGPRARSRPRPPRPRAARPRSRSRCGYAPATRSSGPAGRGACRPRT